MHISQRQLDSASRVAEAIIAAHQRDNEVLASARVSLGRILLHRGKKDQAADIFNQCIAAHTSSERVWDSWMELAAIYEYDFAYKDAMTIYQKVFRECPTSLPVRWMAAIKAGELAYRDSLAGDPQTMFAEVAQSQHPFPVPRLVAQFYLGQISESSFRARWNQFYPDSRFYLHYFARKAMFKDEVVVARVYLQEFKQKLPEHSWDYFRVFKILNNLSRW